MLRLCRSLVIQCGRRCHCTLSNPKTHVHTVEEVEEELPQKKLSDRYLRFREMLRSNAPLGPLPEAPPHPAHEKEPLVPWPKGINPHTGEVGGPAGPEPTRYGDWERKGRVTDF
ncbi:succinate dehydrogenase assembly factor 4, mitochondrial [Drosophila serrata]|uniref:succinate dehydrogenase assembly factor 4, mitochondrial n=1 Tax=Drosophila serrata TaxID=7274 RepID=UPI000A1D3514|nr:succinate dehydrogenase assembly factor 4, mitochondrial [Drosophila serrata]KAH8393728.1 hypothetical protein KR200_010411 [Drosophila serrata]